ncbi:MAG TPA: hypothetical protein DIC19_02410 [Erysipelotrichaceae bacterium]|nr:hypothetical protein [Erysipelotrichaceae bacterium]
MKRLFIFLITLLLVLVQAEAWTITYAAADVPVACAVNQYSVDRITGKDQFTKLGCFEETQFQQAYDFMLSEAAVAPNVVIRHKESYSPMNIVAADRAMAYSQNHTYLYSDTINIWKDKAQTIPYTYINQANPLYYYNTQIKSKSPSEVIKPSDLVAEVEVNGARGFIQVNGIDIIPLIYVENRSNDWFISFTTRNSLDNTYTGHIIRPNITQYKVSDVSSTTKTGTVTIRQISVQVDTALYVNTYSYGVAPDWLPIGTYYSPDGIVFYTDMDLKNPITVNGVPGLYFNYYDFLNLRTVTQYSSLELDEYFNYYFAVNKLDPNSSVMKDKGSAFVNAQNTYGMNALMIYSMAIHESAYGTSSYAVNRFNLFGYGAYDSNPDSAYTFDSVEQSVDEHMGINLRHYLDYSNYNATTNNSLFYASNIGIKGAGINTRYASDPWWSIKIAGYAFRIDRYLGLKDLNKYQLAIFNSTDRTYYKDVELQNIAYSINERATNYPSLITASIVNDYIIQSTNPIINGTIITGSTPGLVPYDWNASRLYIDKSKLSLINTSSSPITVIETTDVLLTKLVDFRWSSDTELYIKGRGILDHTAMDDISIVTHTLNMISLIDGSKTSYPLTVLPEDFNNYNGLVYNSVGFEGVIDLSLVSDGSFALELVTTSGDTTGSTLLREPALNPIIPNAKIVNNVLYKTVLDSWNTMEYHIIKTSNMPTIQISPSLPTEYMSVARIYDFIVDDNQLLSLRGLGYINNANMGEIDDKALKLLIVDQVNLSTVPFSIDLIPTTGDFDPSLGAYDYIHSWFNESNIDLSKLLAGNYKLMLYIKSNSIEDIVEFRDFGFKGDIVVENSTRIYTLKFKPERRNYDLIVADKSVSTP